MNAPKRYRACKTFGNELIDMLCPRLRTESSTATTSIHQSNQNLSPFIESSPPFYLSSDSEISSCENSSNDLNCSEFGQYENSFEDELTSWFVESNISNDLANKLLKILNKKISGLPKDIRTLKKTPTDAPTVVLSGGEYIHYGLKYCLTDFLKQNVYTSDKLALNINVDGLPVSKSSLKNVWPILININGTNSVLVVGVFSGCSHPKDVNDYLKPFVDEMKLLIENGLHFEEKFFKIICRSFICDAPAKALILGVKNHSGYSCCTKCTQKGEWKQNRIIFPFHPHPYRTDEEFRHRSDVAHHKEMGLMTLETLPIDMVKQFPLDYMHVVCL